MDATKCDRVGGWTSPSISDNGRLSHRYLWTSNHVSSPNIFEFHSACVYTPTARSRSGHAYLDAKLVADGG